MDELNMNKIVKEIQLKIDNKMEEFIRVEVLQEYPLLEKYDFNIKKIASAIQKQMPKKPNWIGDWECPCCWVNNLQTRHKYCWNCGQKIDWSEK